MSKKYKFIAKITGRVIEGVTIDESAKEDIKELMGWDESQFILYTELIEPIPKKRKSMEIWRNIQSLLGIDLDNYEESIRYSNFNQKEMLKLEKAIIKLKSSLSTEKENKK